LLISCSPRDLLTRRLAADLISASDAFRTPQKFTLQTGVVANKVYVSPEYLIFQHHGWISATTIACPTALAPPPCWDLLLTPSGVETVQSLISANQGDKSSLAIPVAKREFGAITGISKQGNVADVDFAWRWVPLNEVGAALYSADLHYKSTVGFREYDDGWRMVVNAARSGQTLDDALQNSELEPARRNPTQSKPAESGP
jgi:hypothetical protein